jgi:hypothetical protein
MAKTQMIQFVRRFVHESRSVGVNVETRSVPPGLAGASKRPKKINYAAIKSMPVFSSEVDVANLEQYRSRCTVATFVFI